jgi:hypothetical protein
MKKIIFTLSILFVTISLFSQTRYIPEATKKIVFTRDGGNCRCCGSSLFLEYDHIIPFSCGGNSTPSNIQLLCQKCNRSKSNGCYCKIHNKMVGHNCCDDVSKSYNYQSPLRKPLRCLGTTKNGIRCKNITTNMNGRCHLH